MDVFARSLQNIKDQTGLKHIIVSSLADMLPFPKRNIINAAAKYIKKMVPAYSLPEAVRFRTALQQGAKFGGFVANYMRNPDDRSEEHTSELQSRENLVCRLLLEKKNKREA